MTKKYTEGQVVSVINGLLSSPEVIDRRGSQTGILIVEGLVDYIYRTLNSDIDSVYSLIKLLVTEQVSVCGSLISKLTEVYELSSTAPLPDESIDQNSVNRIRASLREASLAGEERQKIEIQTAMNLIESFTRSGTSSKTPQYARSRCTQLLLEILSELEDLSTVSDGFVDIVDDYMSADFESVSRRRQLSKSEFSASLLDENMSDPNQAKLVMAVISGLLAQRSQSKRDIRDPKFRGQVTLLPGERAALSGGTLPLIIQESAYASADDYSSESTVRYSDGSSELDVVVGAEKSQVPVLRANVSSTGFLRSESGNLLPKSNEPFGHPRMLCSHDFTGSVSFSGVLASDVEVPSFTSGEVVSLYAALPFLKTCVIPGSVTLTFYSLQTKLVENSNYQAEKVFDAFKELYSDEAYGLTPYVGLSEEFLEANFDSQTITKLVHSLTDDGVSGTLLDQQGVEWGSINYETGEIVLSRYDLEFDLSEDVHIIYKYNPYKELRSYIAESGSHSQSGEFEEWNNFYLWDGTGLLNTSISNADVNSASDLVSEINAGFDHGVQITGSALTIQGLRGGSAARLAFPAAPELVENTSLFAPVWQTTPININQAIGLTYSSHRQAFGSDTLLSEVTISEGSSAAYLSVSRRVLMSDAQFSFVGGSFDTIQMVGDSSGLAIGDDLEVTSPESMRCHVKIVELLSSGAVRVNPGIPATPSSDTYDELDSDGYSMSGVVRRDALKISSSSDSPLVTLSTVSEGLGFSGTASALTTSFSLSEDISISNVVTEPGYTIKPGDAVVQFSGDVTKPIGHVQSIDGNSVSIRVTGAGHDYPYRDVEIYSLGWSSFSRLSSKVSIASRKISEVSNSNELLVKGLSYLNSGSGQNAFYQAVLTLRDNIGELRNLYLDYDANTVNTTGRLLSHLRDDRISAFSELLLRCSFSQIAQATPISLSNQSSLESQMEQVSDMLGGSVELWERGEGRNLFVDYTNDSTDHEPHRGGGTVTYEEFDDS